MVERYALVNWASTDRAGRDRGDPAFALSGSVLQCFQNPCTFNLRQVSPSFSATHAHTGEMSLDSTNPGSAKRVSTESWTLSHELCARNGKMAHPSQLRDLLISEYRSSDSIAVSTKPVGQSVAGRSLLVCHVVEVVYTLLLMQGHNGSVHLPEIPHMLRAASESRDCRVDRLGKTERPNPVSLQKADR